MHDTHFAWFMKESESSLDESFLPLKKWLSELSKKTVKTGIPIILIGGWTAYELYNSVMTEDD